MAGKTCGTLFISLIASGLLVAHAASAQALSPCANAIASPARPTETQRVPVNAINCRTAGQVSIPSGQIFRCRGAEDAEGNPLPNKILLKPVGAPVQVLPIDDFGPSLTEMTLYSVNLGGSAAPEHVLALWQAQQNGFGTNFWSVSVFDTSWRLLKTYDNVEDFGPRHLVQSDGACALAITKYERYDMGGETAPLFYEARFVGLVSGRVDTLRGLDPVKRRYTRAFERQRLATFDRQRGIAKVGDLISWMNARN